MASLSKFLSEYFCFCLAEGSIKIKVRSLLELCVDGILRFLCDDFQSFFLMFELKDDYIILTKSDVSFYTLFINVSVQ